MAAEHACDTDTPQRHGALGCQAIRHYRQSYGIPACSRSSSISTRRDAVIGRHPKVNLSQLRRIAASSSSDRAPGTWGCVLDAIVTGDPGRLDRWRHPGIASKTSQPTRGTGTEETEDRHMSAHAPGVGKASLRTRTSRSKAAMRSSQPANTTGSRTAECDSEGAARCESAGAQA